MVAFQMWSTVGDIFAPGVHKLRNGSVILRFVFLFFWLLFKEWVNGGKKSSQSYLMTKLTLLWIIRSTYSRAASRHRSKTLAIL